MIAEFTLRPKSQSKKALYLFIAFVAAALITTAIYLTAPLYRGIIGLADMVMVIGAVFIYTKYLAAEYYYDVILADETPLFVIRHKLGNRETTLCRIELRTIVSVERMTSEERKSHKCPDGYTKYFYCPTFAPEVTYLITSRSRNEKAEITVEANEEFAETLRRFAEEARAGYAEFDDEY